MLAPTIHTNGSSKQDLLAGVANALVAGNKLLDELRKITPHGRDYYVQGPHALAEAQAGHADMVAMVSVVVEELRTLGVAIRKG